MPRRDEDAHGEGTEEVHGRGRPGETGSAGLQRTDPDAMVETGADGAPERDEENVDHRGLTDSRRADRQPGCAAGPPDDTGSQPVREPGTERFVAGVRGVASPFRSGSAGRPGARPRSHRAPGGAVESTGAVRQQGLAVEKSEAEEGRAPQRAGQMVQRRVRHTGRRDDTDQRGSEDRNEDGDAASARDQFSSGMAAGGAHHHGKRRRAYGKGRSGSRRAGTGGVA